MESMVTPDINNTNIKGELPRPGIGLIENPFFEGDKKKKKKKWIF